jgi:glycosyltransferase involved in cell wall biosynthesis
MEAKLMIVGQGPLEDTLKRKAVELEIADDVSFPGFRPSPWPFYASANLFALSSDYEGYPLVLLEAMKSGLPVVATDCPSGPREILAAGAFGQLVPVGDEIGLANAMMRGLKGAGEAQEARERANLLSGAKSSQRYLSLLVD